MSSRRSNREKRYTSRRRRNKKPGFFILEFPNKKSLGYLFSGFIGGLFSIIALHAYLEWEHEQIIKKEKIFLSKNKAILIQRKNRIIKKNIENASTKIEKNGFTIQVADKNKGFYRFFGKWGAYHHLLAKKNEPFEIRIHNPSIHSVAVMIKIDGLNVISGQKDNLENPATRKWVLPAQSYTKVEKWQTNPSENKKFIFSNLVDNYSEQASLEEQQESGKITVAIYYNSKEEHISENNTEVISIGKESFRKKPDTVIKFKYNDLENLISKNLISTQKIQTHESQVIKVVSHEGIQKDKN